MKKLEREREELKKKVSELTEERDTANRPLADAQFAISDKAKLLSEANDSINDLKLKLDGLDGKLSEAGAREETLNKALEDEKRQRSNVAAEHEDYAKSINLWISRLVDVAGRITAKLAAMGMPDVRYSQEPNVSPNARLTLFFEGVPDALEQLHSNRAVYLANGSWRLCRGALTKVLTKVAFWNPASTSPTRWRACRRMWTLRRSRSISSPSSAASTESRGWKASGRTSHPISHCRCEFMPKTILS